MMDITQILMNSVVLIIQSGIAPSQDPTTAFKKSPELGVVQSNTECFLRMIRITSDSSSFLPHHAQPYHGGALRGKHLFPKHWNCNWERLLAVKSNTQAVKTRHWHTELSCAPQDCKFSRLHSEKEKQKTKQQRKCFSMVQPGAKQMCRSRQLNSATCSVGCLPQADWKKDLNRVCCGDVIHPEFQGSSSSRPFSQGSYFHLRADVRYRQAFFLLPLPVSSSHCGQ